MMKIERCSNFITNPTMWIRMFGRAVRSDSKRNGLHSAVDTAFMSGEYI